MPEATVNGLNIFYRETGEGFPLVFLHGYTGNSRNWAFTVPTLRDRFRIVSPDHRGHGLSEKPADESAYSFEVMADDAVQLLGQLGITQCYLVGHSMGGMISQYITLQSPGLVRALVLVDTAAETMPHRSEQRRRQLQIARDEGMEAAFEEGLRINPDAERLKQNPAYIALWREHFLMTGVDAYIACGNAMAERVSLISRLGEITVPTLIICGERDEGFLEPSRVMYESIAGSELEIIPKAGHGPQMEAPAEFNAALTGFLDRVHAPAPV